MKIPNIIDYNQLHSWVAIPNENHHIEINNFDDSFFVSNYHLADVFFIHGTVLENEGKILLDPYNKKHRLLPIASYKSQASCFEKYARIFQPHYRQLSLETILNSGQFDYNSLYEEPLKDIIAAYNAYMVNWNLGRPLIIAGHGQGSVLALNLLKHLKQTGRNFDKLVAAYLIGCSVTIKDLEECGLPLSANFDDIQCIITYNSLAQGTQYGLMLLPDALCTNPLNWCSNMNFLKKIETNPLGDCTMAGYAEKNLHLGRVDINLDGSGEEIPEFSDAWIDVNSGGLIVGAYNHDNAPLCSYLPRGDLHLYNYELFYRNIENNSIKRIQAFNSAKQYHFYKKQMKKSRDNTLR